MIRKNQATEKMNVDSIQSPINTDTFIEKIEAFRVQVQSSLDKNDQAEMGQFLTPYSVAKLMVDQLPVLLPSIKLIDPGAGIGSLTAAFVLRAVNSIQKPGEIKVTAYEIDPLLAKYLKSTFFPEQDMIDQIIKKEFELNLSNDDEMIDDPILAKKKIKEALSILQMLAVPRAQQNDRSALTLLALVNLKASSNWSEATENLIGMTEMMDYFKDYYGITYAPNTRETVRRQTVHPFLQMGLVIANPDDLNRPINSPKTRYVIEQKVLHLLKTFGSSAWEGNLHEYLQQATSMGRLQVMERTMPMIPVTLPDGEQILLTSGGQNELIKEVIEKFCPRYTPGGKVIYIGDADEKITENEIRYFEQIGIKIDKHGKMPDVIVALPEKKWLFLIEAVTSHGPIDLKRHNELKEIFSHGEYGLVYVTTFPSRKVMNKYLSEIAWETEVWVSESPSHLIHFNGDRFMGPYANDC